ncbi:MULTISPECIES: heme transporter [Gordonia]|uniref:heme transporter n=1 Tax=Gordonia TaxID=2053 RepID=UPI0012BB2855|nr:MULTISPECIES: heme transporter [Gordonia]MDH3010129.1 heme transporter [Gordonia alkanivorans]MDH3046876.1 heme transporter [Gordonia alkanivorans]QGP87758.1 heme transporter [Gordonia sp. 135]
MPDSTDDPIRPSDLETLLATPDFGDSAISPDIDTIAARLPSLAEVVGVTVAGPVIMNAVGVHGSPTPLGGPLAIGAEQISLRLNPSRLSSALQTDPAALVPPTLRLFDSSGNTAHATYLTENSDRLAFESLSLSTSVAAVHGSDPAPVPPLPGPEYIQAALHDRHDGDQVGLFDSILLDGGTSRLRLLAQGHGSRGIRVDPSRVITSLEHAALLGMTVTVAAAAPGCMQMRQDRLDGAREHRGQMVLASGTSRVMVNFNHVEQCWVTRSPGVWGPTAAIEFYDRRSRCCLVVTHTGPVPRATAEAWDHLTCDLAS